MVRVIETDNTDHAKLVSQTLLDATDDPHSIRIVTGTNGRQAFQVDDDFPDVDIPGAPAPEAPEIVESTGRKKRAPRKTAAKAAAAPRNEEE